MTEYRTNYLKKKKERRKKIIKEFEYLALNSLNRKLYILFPRYLLRTFLFLNLNTFLPFKIYFFTLPKLDKINFRLDQIDI